MYVGRLDREQRRQRLLELRVGAREPARLVGSAQHVVAQHRADAVEVAAGHGVGGPDVRRVVHDQRVVLADRARELARQVVLVEEVEAERETVDDRVRQPPVAGQVEADVLPVIRLMKL